MIAKLRSFSLGSLRISGGGLFLLVAAGLAWPAAYGMPRIKLNRPLAQDAAGGVSDVVVSPDGAWAVFRALGSNSGLFSAPTDGSAAPIKISVQVGPVFAISPDSERVVYLAAEDSAATELYSAPIDGSSGSVRLNPALVSGGSVVDFRISPVGGRVVYRAEQDTNDVLELYSVPIDGSASSVKLNGALIAAGDVQDDYAIAASGEFVGYRADQDIDGQIELFGVPIDASAAAQELSALTDAARDVNGFAFSPDGLRAVYAADQDSLGVLELYSVPSDGSSSPVKLNPALVSGGNVTSGSPQITPDGERVLYCADQEVNGRDELYSVPIEGGSTVKLNGAITTGDVFSDFAVTPDGNVVLFRARMSSSSAIQLYTAPVDGSGSATLMHAVLGGNKSVRSFVITPDGSQVVFLGDLDKLDKFELFRAPVDASAAPVKVNQALFSQGTVGDEYRLSAGGDRVLYTAVAALAGLVELFSAPLDGSAAPLLLSSPPPSFPRAFSALHATETRGVFLVDGERDDVTELYAAPLDASAAACKLNDPIAGGRSWATSARRASSAATSSTSPSKRRGACSSCTSWRSRARACAGN